MKNKLIVFLILCLWINTVHGVTVKDSTQRKFGFGCMLSMNSLLLKSVSDNPANFFYSDVFLEPQFSFKKHTFGIGMYRNKSVGEFNKQDVPYKEKRLRLTLVPTYSYLTLKSKYWHLYTGLGIVFKYRDTFQKAASNYETITKRTTEIEKGVSIFARVQFNLHKNVSLNLELPIYLTHTVVRTNEQYPLTPSMSSDRKSSGVLNTSFFIPSNLFIKVSF